ncbi:MAG TPA: hypothetical protein VGO00_16945 [Kofleriaceae bacterium]|nr:hypothetical protein [Kofleriaceae bacterium]
MVAIVARDVSAEPCVAHVHLAGAATAIDKVTGALRQLGVPVGPAQAGCRTVEADVEIDPTDDRISVAVQMAGRTEGRVLSDPAMAAAWLDSWVRDDDAISASDAAPPPAPPSIHVAVSPPAASRFLDRTSLSVDYEQGFTDDGSSWTGGSVSACVRIGEFCVGARARARFESSLTVNLATASRNDLSAMATASRAFAIGRIVASPELGVGVGRMSTSRVDCVPAMNPNGTCTDPNDPTCQQMPQLCIDAAGNKIYVGDNLHGITYTPRFAAAMRLALPLFDRVWLDALAEITFAPFGHSDVFAAHGTGDDPELSLPGEPTRAVQLGIGLRVGAP